jgi:uncharacterized protein YyaL (SSP411 family)
MVSSLAAGSRVLDAGATGEAGADGADDAVPVPTADEDAGETPFALGRPHAAAAREALSFVRDRLWDADDRRLARRFKDGDVKGTGFLEDYAFLARGAFDLYGVTGEVDHLAFAVDLARVVVSEFYDADAGTLYFTPQSGEGLVTRPQGLTDQSTPSSIGVATGLLVDLDGFAPGAGFGDVADDVLATHADRVTGSPLEHVSLATAAAKRDRGSLELTVAAEEVPADWRETLAERYLPGAVVTRRPSTDEGLAPWLDRLGLDEAPPVWAGREARDGPTVYACEAFTCSPPLSSMAEAVAWFEDDGDGGAPDDDVDLPPGSS